jgi:DNA-binding transcriptional regulator YhcF (GntR family)
MVEKALAGNEQLLTAEEIAAILKVSLNTVHNRKWQLSHGCPIIKIGKRTYAVASIFWEWVKERGMVNEKAA